MPLILGVFKYWRLAIIVCLLAVAGYYVWQYNSMTVTISRQSQEIVALNRQLQVKELEAEAVRRANRVLTDTLETQAVLSRQFDELADRIMRTEEDKDGEVAPVLRDALSGLDGLLRPGT